MKTTIGHFAHNNAPGPGSTHRAQSHRGCLILALFALISLSWAQQPKFESKVRLVMIDVQVAEKGSGRILDVLGPQDFEVLDEGELREIREFHIETTPLDVVIVFAGFDGYWNQPAIKRFQRETASALAELRVGDRVAVIRSPGTKGVAAPLGEDHRLATRALILPFRSLQKRNCPIDAAAGALALFPPPGDVHRRSAIVVLTDDNDRCSQTPPAELASKIAESGVTLNTVGVCAEQLAGEAGTTALGLPETTKRVSSQKGSGASLRPVVEATGGEMFPCARFQEGFAQLLRRLHGRYLLGFYAEPETSAGFHEIQVKLREEARKRYPNAEVKARRRYRAEP